MSERILFTCAGTTDPIRGERDGGILHIMRYYRPDKIYLFLSAEMSRFEENDARFTKMVQYPKKAADQAAGQPDSARQWNWAGYSPELIKCDSGIENPSDLDALYGPLASFFEKAAAENPDSQILINLSSGTPQMQVILAQFATDLKHDVLGIQVAAPERRASTTGRTNARDYDVDCELELNEDEKLDAMGQPINPNRCVEPEMVSLRRQNERQHYIALIDRREYHALYEIHQKALPSRVWPMIRHLEARSSLRNEDAARLAEQCGRTGVRLYPLRGTPEGEYRAVSEYYLILRNLQLTEHYTEFVLRLNPFLMKLSLRLIECWLPCRFEEIVDSTNNLQYLNRDKMLQKARDILHALENETGRMVDPNYALSLITCVNLVIVLNARQNPERQIADNDIKLLKACIQLNQNQRNLTAHELHAVTARDLVQTCTYEGTSYNAQQLIEAFGRLLQLAWPNCCDAELFTVYDRCNEYLKRNI